MPDVKESRLSMHATKPACTYVQALHIRHCSALRPQHAHQLLHPSLRVPKRKWQNGLYVTQWRVTQHCTWTCRSNAKTHATDLDCRPRLSDSI